MKNLKRNIGSLKITKTNTSLVISMHIERSRTLNQSRLKENSRLLVRASENRQIKKKVDDIGRPVLNHLQAKSLPTNLLQPESVREQKVPLLQIKENYFLPIGQSPAQNLLAEVNDNALSLQRNEARLYLPVDEDQSHQRKGNYLAEGSLHLPLGQEDTEIHQNRKRERSPRHLSNDNHLHRHEDALDHPLEGGTVK